MNIPSTATPVDNARVYEVDGGKYIIVFDLADEPNHTDQATQDLRAQLAAAREELSALRVRRAEETNNAYMEGWEHGLSDAWEGAQMETQLELAELRARLEKAEAVLGFFEEHGRLPTFGADFDDAWYAYLSLKGDDDGNS